ncbi:MAG TPA: class I SAM-dependent methyltransferase [Steroidobacteraceae bacterium]|nr:class I SAM-dependent methyltransferase [Steroidobacteraceae bacterium]
MSGPGVSQAMRPHGIGGRLFAVAMEWINTPAHQRAVELISPAPGDRVLEVGFGTGALLRMLAPRIPGGLLAGVDHSELMVRQTRARLARFAPAVRLDIRQGTDRDLSWPDAYFTHLAALHAFQFWPDPDATLRRFRALLRPGGSLLLILRSHVRRAPDWLPNPISRSADEVGGTMEALERAGFERPERLADVGSSAVLKAQTFSKVAGSCSPPKYLRKASTKT